MTKDLLTRACRLLSPASCLCALERVWLAMGRASEKPQLFISGLPRSGTTLVYQYIVHRLSVAYFTNLVGRLPRSPCVATFCQSKLNGAYRSDFSSDHGKVKGPMAPREAGAFWCRFFDIDDYQGLEQLEPRRVELLRRSVHCVQRIFGDRPFVNKNVKHLLRLPALAEIFPAAFFLIVERNIDDVALSLLRARGAGEGGASAWLSARPPDYADLKDLPPEHQVAGQVTSLTEKLHSDLEALEPRRVLRVRYEDFCADPEALIAIVQSAIGVQDFRSPPVPSFPVARNRPCTALEEALIVRLRGLRDVSAQRVP